jgi:phosphatidate phosphatase APP1
MFPAMARSPVHALVARGKSLKRRLKRRLGLFDPLCILPFRSHGTPARLIVKGRVLEREGVIYDRDAAAGAGDAVHRGKGRLAVVRESLRRLRSDEIPGARLAARFGALRRELTTDGEGYFRAALELAEPVAPGWHEVELTLLASIAGSTGTTATARVLVPPDDAELGIITDVDDTVIRTGATSRLRMMRTVLLHDAHEREPFPGAADFYQALVRGKRGRGDNPIFYVSRSGWNLYDLFDACFELHRLPRGPMFLTDLAVLEPKSSAVGGGEDKLSRIRELFATYPRLGFVLVGDSGQEDPEIYRRIALEHPGRVRAVYIRDVTRPRRDAEVHAIIDALNHAGVPALATAETAAAAAHAARLGLIR